MNKVFVAFKAETSALQCADDASGNGLAEAEGVADGHNEITDLKFTGVGNFHLGEFIGINGEYGNIEIRVAAGDFGFIGSAVHQ